MSDGAASRGASRTASVVLALASFVVVLPGLAGPAGDDPLHSRACERARAELDAALAAPDAAHSERLARARRAALRECLGTDTGERRRTGAPYPAQVVPPTTAAEPAAATHAPAPLTPAPPPVDIPRPTVITTCDAASCWDSAGRRLNQMGPMLVGPRGVCTAVAGVVTCP